ncbi:sphingomyelin phosphodiesterase [Streptomyces sp. NBC_00233]|uniref:sphingomyelin phosphodiesterase n=1 Tax=Streptomyces sp. NBC_00233 TaxID=2975686 RepID=UPI00224DD7BB|nr:sphingomyelin phosphodiesterase [Streptomyces sp. NBC_00233]MCX5231459.1 sphingomyelin phosphodiesterase [Streptomyces sp. NBC_00233]MCX5233023.1 sphingomyelin phosphodiesterase [Streptomyces sp. NBC_00233]
MRIKLLFPAVTFLAPACGLALLGPSASPAEASSAVAPPALNIVSSNTMLLPSAIVDQWAQDFRGELIGSSSYVKNRDVVVFQELFDNSASDILMDKLKTQYPYQTPVIGRSTSGWDSTQGDYSFFTPEDGGVSILSRWPITKKVQFIYNDACGADYFSGKGFGYARLNVNGANVHVLGTHLQADDTACGSGEAARVRAAQLGEMRAFVNKLNIPANEAIVYAGDMNIVRGGAEYPTLLSKLNAVPPSFAGALYTMDPTTNSLAKARYAGKPRQWLDYILFDQSHARPASWTNTGLDVHSGSWNLDGQTYYDYSDHYPIQGS